MSNSFGSMATKLSHLAPPPPFDAESESSSLARWKEWRERFEMYLLAANITDAKQKRALLLYVAGPAVHKIFNTLTDTGTDYKTAIEKLDAYFQPKKNLIYERYVFKQTRPNPDESADRFVTRLRQLAETCEFANLADEIRDQFVITWPSKTFRIKLLREPALTLEKLQELARAQELADHQARMMAKQGDNELLNRLSNDPERGTSLNNDRKPVNCRNCGNIFEAGHKQVCPAKGKSCRSCGKANHFAKVCRSSPRGPKAKPKFFQHKNQKNNRENRVHTTTGKTQDNSSGSDDEFTFILTAQTNNDCNNFKEITKTTKGVVITARINNTDVKLTLDSGATTNILDNASFKRIRKNDDSIRLQPTSIKIYPYNSQVPLPIRGKFEAKFRNGTTTTTATFYVVEGNSGSLLGYQTATELGLLHVNVNQTTNNSVPNASKTSALVAQYKQLFTGIGKLKNYQQKLHVDPK